MVNFRGFCGGEETLAHLKHLLEVFDFCPSDIDICVVDCRADVQLASRLANWYTFPCLCHIINMRAKKLIFEETAYLRENDLESERGFDEPGDIADLVDDMDDYVSVVKTAAPICRKIHRSVRLQEKLQDAQKIKGLPQVSVVIENVNRWNSLLKMLERFVSLKVPLIYMFENELDDFDWLKLRRIIGILAPLRDTSLDLQKDKVGPKEAVDVLCFLNKLAGTKNAVTSAIRPVLEKWLDGNAISNALLHNRGEFYQYVKS